MLVSIKERKRRKKEKERERNEGFLAQFCNISSKLRWLVSNKERKRKKETGRFSCFNFVTFQVS